MRRCVYCQGPSRYEVCISCRRPTLGDLIINVVAIVATLVMFVALISVAWRGLQ